MRPRISRDRASLRRACASTRRGSWGSRARSPRSARRRWYDRAEVAEPMVNARTRLGPYRAIAQIGAGGMGEVYRATDTRLGREVAIKVLPPSSGSDPDRLRRFEQEARATGILNHPNVLSIFD